MRRPDASREKSAHRAQMLAVIARRLREEYDATQPLPAHLSDLVRKIEQSERIARDAGCRTAVEKKR
jgi:hypothetical protein